MLQGPAPKLLLGFFWYLCFVGFYFYYFFMSFLWVIEKSLKKTLLTNQPELKECGGVWGATPLPVGLLLEPKPCRLKREGPGLLSFPPQLLVFCAQLSRPPRLPHHSCVLAFRVPLEVSLTCEDQRRSPFLNFDN